MLTTSCTVSKEKEDEYDNTDMPVIGQEIQVSGMQYAPVAQLAEALGLSPRQ